VNELTQYLKGRRCQGFTAHPYYSQAGDFLTYYFQDDECYAERLDDVLTVYLSFKTKKFVGFKLKGVRHLQKTLGSFGFRVFEDGKPMLGMLFMAGVYAYATPAVIDQYRELAEATKSVPLDKEVLEAVCS